MDARHDLKPRHQDDSKVTVIIPVHNREGLLVRAVQSCLESSPEQCEILIINDGSTDSTACRIVELAEQYSEKVRAIHQKHQGVSAARNRGLAEASGAYIKFLDSDDMLAEGSLKEEVDALESSHAPMVIGNVIEMDDEGSTIRVFRHDGDIRDEICRPGYFGLGSALFRYSSIPSFLRFNESLQLSEDKDFLFRCMMQMDHWVYLDRPSYVYCAHAGRRLTGKDRKEDIAVLFDSAASCWKSLANPTVRQNRMFLNYAYMLALRLYMACRHRESRKILLRISRVAVQERRVKECFLLALKTLVPAVLLKTLRKWSRRKNPGGRKRAEMERPGVK